MTYWALRILAAMPLATALFAQQNKRPEDAKSARKAFEAQSASSIKFGSKDGMETVEIQNVAYEVTSTFIPGRPKDERLVLRKTIRSRYVVDDIGTDATVTLEAWPLGVDLKQKPLYSIAYTGVDGQTAEQALFVGSRGTEEVDWWSVYKLSNGQHLFDTYVPLLKFSISREIQTERYVGLEVPPDDASDVRLKEPHVVSVLTYASEGRVIREALLTCDDPKQAQLLRSFADVTREVALVEGPFQKGSEPSRTIKISFSQNHPSAPATISAMIPVVKDDLDVAHAQLPARIRIAVWKR
jgi:hypothetical protein